MRDTEEVAAGRDRKLAEKFVENLGMNDRIIVYKRIDIEAKSDEETYICYSPPADLTPFFMSGDCAVIKQAIDFGLLEPTGETTYKKSASR